MNKILQKDIDDFRSFFPFELELCNTTFLITGITGLIGGTLARCLLGLRKNIRIIAPVRNINRARSLFHDKEISFIECDLQKFDYSTIGPVDFLVHCASPTSSSFFVESPVETAEFIIESSIRLLQYCKNHTVRGVLFLSSLEAYGEIIGKEVILEPDQGYLSCTDVRSSYPMAKRQVENLCSLYSKEYNVRAMVGRLTQTTGAGVSKLDNRAIVQFTRKACAGEDIIMHTRGVASRPYIYTIDAVNAMLFILLRGENGEIYNIANEDTYISAKDLAEMIKNIVNPSINIRYEILCNSCYAQNRYYHCRL